MTARLTVLGVPVRIKNGRVTTRGSSARRPGVESLVASIVVALPPGTYYADRDEAAALRVRDELPAGMVSIREVTELTEDLPGRVN